MASGSSRRRRIGDDRRGVTAIEYALIGALIFLVIIGGVSALGSGMYTTLYLKIASSM